MPRLMKCGEILRVALLHRRMRHFLAQHFLPDRAKEQSRGDLRVRGLFLDQRPRRQDRRFPQLIHRHAVVQVLDRLGADDGGIDFRAEAVARGADRGVEIVEIERTAHPAIDHVNHGFLRRRALLR